MPSRFYLDWVPFSSLPIDCKVLDTGTVTPEQFNKFFNLPISPLFSPQNFCLELAERITGFEYRMRNDGVLIFWFHTKESKAFVNLDKDKKTARMLSFGLKEKLNHRHTFHGSSNSRSFENFQPVFICSLDESIPPELQSFWKKGDWERQNLADRVGYVLFNDEVLDAVPVNNLIGNGTYSKLGLSKLRENFARTYNCFLLEKDALRVNSYTGNNPSIAMFMFMAGISTPLWQEMISQVDNSAYGFFKLVSTVVTIYLFVVYFLIKNFFFVRNVVNLSEKNQGKRKLILDILFSHKTPLKRKIVYPIFVFLVLLAVVFPYASYPVPVLDGIHEFFLGGMVLTVEQIKQVFLRDNSMLTVSVAWVLGVFVYGGIEVIAKRMKILKLCRYTIGALHFGNNFTKILLSIRGKTDEDFNRVSFKNSIKSIENFMAHEYLKLISATVLVFVACILAILPALSTLANTQPEKFNKTAPFERPFRQLSLKPEANLSIVYTFSASPPRNHQSRRLQIYREINLGPFTVTDIYHTNFDLLGQQANR